MQDKALRKTATYDTRITGGLWANYQKMMASITIPYQWRILNDELEGIEKSGAIENFRIAAKESDRAYYGTCFQDSDVGKLLEGIAYMLTWAPHAGWEEKADGVINLMARAQWPDGYLNTYFTVAEPNGRFSNIRECDELYCFGHLAEAAVAYAQATGMRKFLDIMCRYADLICDTFGEGAGQIPACDGHPEAELAFVRLYEATGEDKYLRQAGFQLNIRGSEPYYYDIEWERLGRESFHPHLKGIRPSDNKGYDQQECPLRELDHPVGHAVKLCYLLAGMAAYSFHTGDKEMLSAAKAIFEGIRDKQMYVTGAVGASRHQEAFTKDYHLPNDRAYGETCASVAMVFAMHRLLKSDPSSAYADVMERVLYNAVPAGISQDGCHFFYVNPLEVYPPDIAADADYVDVKPVRQKWFRCACCPPNLVRLMASIGNYIYTQRNDTIYAHLFAQSEAHFSLESAQTVCIEQETNFPWEGRVCFRVRCEAPFHLAIRLPDWSCHTRLFSGGTELELTCLTQNGYAVLPCPAGETILDLQLDMTPYAVEAHPAVKADAGKVALMRGPVVYCAEEADNGPLLHNLSLDPNAGFAVLDERVFGAPVLLARTALRENTQPFQGLYRRCQTAQKEVSLRLIPYFLWGNRRKSSQPEEMLVWIRRMSGKA